MSDLISRQDAINCCSCLHPEDCWDEIRKLPSADEQDNNRLYIKIYADDEPSRKAEKLYQICGETENQEVAQWIKEYFPSADRPTTDCTKFMEWLKAEALDEENWELNAVANGEVICRKFRKLGWLDVEDGYYVDTRPTVDKEYLIDLIQEAVYDGEACAKLIDLVDRPTGEWEIETDTDEYGLKRPKLVCSKCKKEPEAWDLTKLFEFCPNCGARMYKGGEEE